MTSTRILAEDLGKRYTLEPAAGKYRTLREDLMHAVAGPLRGLRSALTNAATAGGPPDIVWALRNVSIEVGEGEVFGVIGRNGAGKSTLLKLLARIITPTEGYARVRGRIGTLLEVGAGFHSELSGRDNIYLSGSILGMTRTEITRKFDQIVAFAGVDRFIDTSVKRYSTGMYLRLAFSVAAHLDADILFVDELLAVGDAEFQKRCLGRITELTHSGRTVVFVSHNMAAIRSLCDRCCLLDGRVTRYGDVDDCIAHYLQSTSEAIQPIVWLPRPRNASPRMLSVALISGGAFASKIFMGDEVTIRVTFESDTPLQNPRIGYSIRGETGESLLSGNNRYQQSAGYALPVTSGSIRCELGRVPLMRGRYWVSLYLGDAPLHDSHSVEDALQFEVIERDLWGMGATPDPRVSQLWWPTRFEFD